MYQYYQHSYFDTWYEMLLLLYGVCMIPGTWDNKQKKRGNCFHTWYHVGSKAQKNTKTIVLKALRRHARLFFFVARGRTADCFSFIIARGWHVQLCCCCCCCCCLHIKPFFLPNDISCTPSVLPDSSS